MLLTSVGIGLLVCAVVGRLVWRPRRIHLGKLSDGWKAGHLFDTGKDGDHQW